MISSNISTQSFIDHNRVTLKNPFASKSSGKNNESSENTEKVTLHKETSSADKQNFFQSTVQKRHAEKLLNIHRARVAEDMVLIKEVIKQKMAEYNLDPAIAISVRMAPSGKIEVAGSKNNPILAMIEVDLNKNSEMKKTLDDHQRNAFLVRYIKQAQMLEEAYGQQNKGVARLHEF